MLGARLEQQRDDHHCERFAFDAPGFNLGEPEPTDARMEDALELFAGGRIGKNEPRELTTPQPPIGADEARSEQTLDFGQGRLAGFDDLTGQVVSVDDGNAALLDEVSGGGFAHADSASESDDFHATLDGFREIAMVRQWKQSLSR